MKFNIMKIMKAVGDTMAHSKEHEAAIKEKTKEPVIGYNGEKNVRAFLDANTSRFTKIEVKTGDFTGKDLVEVFEQITLAVNNALENCDKLWDEITPDAIKKIDME